MPSKSTSKNSHPRMSTYRQYAGKAMTEAYRAIEEEGETIRGAARRFGLPEATLRRRVNEKILVEVTKSGVPPMFSNGEETRLVEHLTLMTATGYRYTRREVIDLANWYAFSLKKRDQDHPLSPSWFSSFMARWPGLKIRRHPPLEKLRSEATSVEVVTSYFKELGKLLAKYNLTKEPECIYIVEERRLKYDATSSSIAANTLSEASSDTTLDTAVTIIGCGNASGEQIPPFLVFPEQRMRKELLKGSAPGTGAAVSDLGWSSCKIFKDYLDSHFLKYARGQLDDRTLLLLFDAHKTYISIPLIDWAKKRNILLFFAPPNVSHRLRTNDVGCFAPFEDIYNHSCNKYVRRHPRSGIDKYAICEIACRAYSAALSPKFLKNFFQSNGIYPLDPSVVNGSVTLQERDFEILACEMQSGDASDGAIKEELMYPGPDKNGNENGDVKKKWINDTPARKGRKIVKRVAVSVDALTRRQELASKKAKLRSRKMKKQPSTTKKKSNNRNHSTPGPSASSGSLERVQLAFSNSSDDEEEEGIGDEEKCCVCNLYRPEELSRTDSVYFTSWGKCMYADCNHWTHLRYCCNVKRLKARDSFYCPCHGLPCVWM